MQDSTGQRAGRLPGERRLKVNGDRLTDAEKLHGALGMNPWSCKQEVQTSAGESKYLQRAIYDGHHHQLGIILVPEPDGWVTAEAKSSSIFSIIAMKTGASRRSLPSGGLGRAKDTAAEPRKESAGV
ncbi:hypothetical protein AMQ83_11495 [Paenibacillus riograndensis]|nr:hypothetical protein AMQ83_11495 [Paenibacillus riograndensis]